MTPHHEPATEAAVRTAGMIAALTHLDAVGFHGIATSISKPSPTIDRGWSQLLRNARTAAAAIDWPDDLQPTATKFVDAAGQLATALDQKDIPAALTPANDVHQAYHALSDGGWSHLSEAAGTSSGSEAHHHEHPPTQ